MPYKAFVSHIIYFHPVCSSVYVSKEWIQALYLTYASSLLVNDFRTTAKSQFELLAAFCSISQETVYQSLVDLENEQLVTFQLLPDVQVNSQVSANIDLIRSSVPVQVDITVVLLQITTRSNSLVSALNTNIYVSIHHFDSQITSITTYFTPYFDENSGLGVNYFGHTCDVIGFTTSAAFYLMSQFDSAYNHGSWPPTSPGFTAIANGTVDGFFSGCITLDGLLVSTFDCLYNISCLKNFANYFPNLSQINVSWSDGLSPPLSNQIAVKDLLSELFVVNWSTTINYSQYFHSCAPKTCTYTITDHMNILYTGTLLLALYGGIAVLLRSITPYVVLLWSKLKRRSTNLNLSNFQRSKCIIYNLRRLNLFKSINRRTPDDIKLQQAATWVYLILLARFRIVDWYGFRGRHFRLLATLCELANRTVTDAVHRFGTQSFVTLNVTSETSFNIQLNTIVHAFAQSFSTNFDLLVKIVQLFTRADQPYTQSSNDNLVNSGTQDDINYGQILKFAFNFTGLMNIDTKAVVCICATNSHCQTPVLDSVNEISLDHAVDFSQVVGSIEGCSTLDSVLLSTLECYYLPSCLSILYKYINYTRRIIDTGLPYLDVKPLVDDPTSSRFPPNTSLTIIIKELMIEDWNPVFSFEKYYEECAPNKCTYSQIVHTNSFVGIIMTLLSSIGGLIVALRLITPLLVKLIFILGQTKRQSKRSQDSPKLISRMKINLIKLINLLTSTLLNLNIFPRRNFGGRITHHKANHSDTLQCHCLSISSTYNHFVQIQPNFHSICSSFFILEDWQMNITSKLASDLFIYDARDYRRFLYAHLQLLAGLCSEAMQSVNSYIAQLLSSFFLTDQLVSPITLQTRINTLVNSGQSNAPTSFKSRLSLLRAINYGNAIVSAYGTNFEFFDPWVNETYSVAITQPIIYDDGCSCATSMNCTTQAGFIAKDSSTLIPVTGLKMGCTPSEALLSSTYK
ncbi:unnamed protein product [Adineta ricciae]|uniref:Uncharacterized protein n=1 Tax=Adineta ricciae TaxID=249248 RepID=A0A816ESX4_ADIRI|nr:unnamed protein product [Adineta ricciae]